MIEFTHTSVVNFDGALRGMRNSWESHHKSDSYWSFVDQYGIHDVPVEYVIGENDSRLAFQLANAGASHAKFLRQIEICVDINAPLYWWKELDQYKVGTVTNSESTMHTIQREAMDDELFSIEPPDDMIDDAKFIMEHLEHIRQMYNTTKDKKYWRYLIQILPCGWMQKRTTTLNYAVVRNAYHDRKKHRLTEWHDFCRWAESLPYSEFITGVRPNE